MREMTHVDLFSGIGGFSLAADWAGFTTVLFCERDPYCQKVLAKHWPEVPCHDDICTLGSDLVPARIDLLTGGFPCQPFSTAGKRLGAADDRHLWPEMLRVIDAIRPRFVCGENVGGLLEVAIDAVLVDLESKDYAAWPIVLPAGAVGAFHRRERVFVVAHTDRYRLEAGADDAVLRLQAADARDARHTRASGGAGVVHAFPERGSVALEPEILGTHDGIPRWVDRLRALGNAVVPQQVYPILAAIAKELQQCPA